MSDGVGKSALDCDRTSFDSSKICQRPVAASGAQCGGDGQRDEHWK